MGSDVMKVSASYNFFNGEEHLIASLQCLRPCVEHISIIWQPVSNAGEPITLHAQQALQQAQHLGLADDVIEFQPNLARQRYENERDKRGIGLDLARKVRASHFLSIDADEFYRHHEFHAARAAIARHGFTSTSVNSFLHVKTPYWRALDVTCCCFICEITPNSSIGYSDFPHPHIDPTRKMLVDPSGHQHFEPDIIAMYHMNLVRRDLMQKLRNSSTTDTDFLKKVYDSLEKWNPGDDFHFPNKGRIELISVENEFNTYG